MHIGCTDGLLTAELSQGGKFLVHGLVLDKGSLAGARQAVQASNLNGTVSLECCPLMPLPYTEDLVNLLVVDDLSAAVKAGLSIQEVIRVLCPGGVAMLADERGMLKDILGKPGIEGVEIIRTSG
ncbi:MAG TPA: class I SAM-dependent methyltransferase, partial [Planctomycetota bacterium]|nr:class I SAM-dependent methyltransferase [Planctomycetota bacterium]